MDTDCTVTLRFCGWPVKVDAADVVDLMQHKWHVVCDKTGRAYAYRNVTRDGREGMESMHVYLMGGKGEVVDHINGDTLDNRRSNLRPASYSDNNANTIKRWGGRAGYKPPYKGVSWDNNRNCWMATIRRNKIKRFLGRFESAEDAARAYDKAARQLHGEFAVLNFPEESHD